LSANAHGVDPQYGPIIETVRSFRLLRPDGSVINVSRTEFPELFRLVIGGYGLFGVILDVTLDVTENVVYKRTSGIIDYRAYPAFFEQHIKGNPKIGLHSAKPSIAPESLLREMVWTTYEKTDERPADIFDLQDEQNIFRNKFLFDLSRSSDWGKSIRWYWQKRLEARVGAVEVVSRNNAMRPTVKFLDHRSPTDTDILQEYFVPMERFVEFIDGLRAIIQKDRISLLSATVRYVPKNTEAYLSYAPQDMFAIVLYINQGLSEPEKHRATEWTKQLVDLARRHHGTFYLTYQLYPAGAQLRQAYPAFDAFLHEKQRRDPGDMFMNQFYTRYASTEVDP